MPKTEKSSRGGGHRGCVGARSLSRFFNRVQRAMWLQRVTWSAIYYWYPALTFLHLFIPYVCFPRTLIHTTLECRIGCYFPDIRHRRIFHNFQSVSCKNTTDCMPYKDRGVLAEQTRQVCPLHLPHNRLDHGSPDTRYRDHTVLLHTRKMVYWNLKSLTKCCLESDKFG